MTALLSPLSEQAWFGKRARVAAYALGVLLVGCSGAASDTSGTGESSVITPDPGEDPDTGEGEPSAKPPELPAMWPGRGSSDCVNHVNADPAITKFQYDANTFILRENKCLNFEANFIYILFGHDKVVVEDTGSIPRDMNREQFARAFPIRATIEGIIGEWLAAHPNEDGTARTRDSLELLVAHTHSHGDHVGGDYQFRQPDGSFFPHTRVAGLRPTDVAAFWGIANWPNQASTVDLGGRQLDILPIPGHEPSSIAIYDHGSKLLLTGDSLYPGWIFVNDWANFRASTQRLARWISETDTDGAALRPINYVFGTHIEKKPEARQFWPYPSWIHATERKLELEASHVTFLAAQTLKLGATSPHRKIMFDDFAIDAF